MLGKRRAVAVARLLIKYGVNISVSLEAVVGVKED